jgi:hypothetical protein
MFRLTLYIIFSETRIVDPLISIKKVIEYYIYIITLKDIIPGFKTQFNLKVTYIILIDISYNLFHYIVLVYQNSLI